jgi:putative Holliday junction resolvase
MARILAVDYGGKRSGIAVTDPLQIIATPLTTVPSHQLMTFLKDYFEKEEVDEVVFGMPSQLDGSDTDATQLVRNASKHFKKQFPQKPLFLHDEKFTSKMALESMIEAGSKRKDRREKGNIDKVSATIILQSYLASKS